MPLISFLIAFVSAAVHANVWLLKGWRGAAWTLGILLGLVLLFWLGGGVILTAMESGWGSPTHRVAMLGGLAILGLYVAVPVLAGAVLGVGVAWGVKRLRMRPASPDSR